MGSVGGGVGYCGVWASEIVGAQGDDGAALFLSLNRCFYRKSFIGIGYCGIWSLCIYNYRPRGEKSHLTMKPHHLTL